MGCAPNRHSDLKVQFNRAKELEKTDNQLTSKRNTKLDINKLSYQPARIIEKDISPYNFYQEVLFLGEGKYGKVYKVIHKQTKAFRAMKITIKKDSFSTKDEEEIVGEFNILKELDHPNILKVFELYDYNNAYYFISEYISDGTLSKKLNEVGCFKESHSAFIMFQVLSALNFCHKNSIIHKDLNLDHILLANNSEKDETETYIVKLADFGSSQKIFDPNYHELIGTPVFMSPEAIDGEITEKGDAWACGVLSYCLLLGDIPFYNINEDEMLSNLLKGKIDKMNSKWDKLSITAQEFLESLLQVNPKKRLSIGDALKHKFIVNSRKRSRVMLDNNKLRIIAGKIMKNTVNTKSLIKIATNYIVHNLLKPSDTEIFRKIFNELNTSDDGRLTKEQIEKGFKNIMNSVELESFVTRTFENIDNDNNGYIEFEEFVAGCLDKKKFFTMNNITNAFNYLTGNSKAGKIRFKELKSILLNEVNKIDQSLLDSEENSLDSIEQIERKKNKKKVMVQEKLIKKAIKDFDANDDGEISFKEFYQVMIEDAGISSEIVGKIGRNIKAKGTGNAFELYKTAENNTNPNSTSNQK